MSTNSEHPLQIPGDKLKKAILEFSERLERDPDLKREKLLQKIVIQFDLSPKESDFLYRNCQGEQT